MLSGPPAAKDKNLNHHRWSFSNRDTQNVENKGNITESLV
jgi:hypothetical protein